MGRIDVLVNNAGINQKKEFVDVENVEFKNVIKVNQTAIFILSREVVRVMLKQECGGSIIHISSMAAHYEMTPNAENGFYPEPLCISLVGLQISQMPFSFWLQNRLPLLPARLSGI